MPQDIDLETGLSGLRWYVEPDWYVRHGRGNVAFAAPSSTDHFHDPNSHDRVRNAPLLLAQVDTPFQFRARVLVDHRAPFDAGALVVYRTEEAWAKLCLERTPVGALAVVSVVTRDLSDDCNAYTVDGREVWLRIAALERAFAFHASTDGITWNLVRFFALDAEEPVRVGLSCQAPVGSGCSARFSDLEFRTDLLRDLRTGS